LGEYSLRYLDSTGRSNTDALGHWLSQEVPAQQAYLRIKTGYFTLNGLSPLKASIAHLVQGDLPISIALGANEKATIKTDVDSLYTLIGCPRPKAKLCVIGCVGGLFHPKVIHLTRTDGSQFAYVGSANVTPAGVNGTNIEAGFLLDTRDGDPASTLNEIAASIDDWFQGTKMGVTHIAGPTVTQQLVVDGILGIASQPSGTGSNGSSGGPQPPKRMKLNPLVNFPSLVTTPPGSSTGGGAGTGASTGTGPTQGGGGLEYLVAEIGAGRRWKQANFPYAVMQNYFGVNPTGNDYIDLYLVAANGNQGPPVSTKVVHVQSQNYRMELASVAGLAYPSSGRPIGVFRKIGAKKFRYRVFFPGDPGHGALNSGLVKTYSGPARELKRIAIDWATLNSIWGACPV
jgi:hypothetical protein